MPKIELNKKYNDLTISRNESSSGEWVDFNNQPGSVVETFLKDKLEDAVVTFDYENSNFTIPGTNLTLNNVLIGKNAFGRPVSYTLIINADPTYTADFAFQQVIIGASTYNPESGDNTPIQVNKTDNLQVSTLFKFLLTGNIAGNTYNETSAQSITFKWFKDAQGSEVDATLRQLTSTVSPKENVLLDITNMFNDAFANRYLGVSFTVPKGKNEETYVFDRPFTLRNLKLNYGGPLLVTSSDSCILTNISLSGVDGEALSLYELQYYLDGVSQPRATLPDGMANAITLNLGNISEGAHDVFVRAVSKSGNLTSNYIQIGFIYLKETGSTLSNAIAMVSEVPDSIDNCNLSKFFKVITTNYLSGSIEIVALKDTTPTRIYNIGTIADARKEENSDLIFKEINLTLLNTDPWLKIDYTSYIEIPGNVNTLQYLKILIKDGNGERATYYYTTSGGSVLRPAYKTINIVNPAYAEFIQYSKGEILGFSQISNGNLFTDLNSNLDSSDGIQLEEVKNGTNTVTLTTFKVSPTEKLFNTPKKLISAGKTPLHKGAFSIEMMFKTYSISDLDDKILTIGNITLCPKHLFVNYEPALNTQPHHIVNASRADFRKEALQHVLITFDPEYKPNTYDVIYDKFFNTGSVSYTKDAKTYPCLKIYVNGTINRVISIGSSTLSNESDFNLQVHPTNSNINFYIFRTYDRALSYEEIKKNYTSSLSDLNDKNTYYENNDILYNTSDFAAGDVDSKRSIINTISLGKCINKFHSVTHSKRLYKDRKVLLVALPNGVLPPFYGNRKEDEPKAAFLVHYPEILTNDGYVPSDYSGVLNGGKIKAQGSSAKKYMFHNTSYSKFNFVKEADARNAAENNSIPPSVSYYKMPESPIEIAKLVGKVNYASSMLSHKQGATKLFHDAYVSDDLGLDKKWMNGGRKAVLEDEFLYFFVNVPKEDLAGITWDYFKDENGEYNFENCYFLGFQTWGSAKGDKPTSGYNDATPHYLMLEGADNDNSAANFKTPWASMQIWGNYNNGVWNSANSTKIENPGTYENGKNYYHQFSGIDTLDNPDYLTGLLINDETIVYNPGDDSGTTSSDKKADAWDVDFGFTEGEGYAEKGKWYLDGEEVDEGTPGATQAKSDNLFFVFKDEVKESLNKFAQFYNLVYTFDFSSIVYIKQGITIDGTSYVLKDPQGNLINLGDLTGKQLYPYKLIFGAGCHIKYPNKTIDVTPGDIYRWDKLWPSSVKADSISQWVPAGLYYKNNNWESLNIATICNNYVNASKNQGSYPKEYSFFNNEEYKELRAKEGGEFKYLQHVYAFDGYEADDALYNMKACMAEAFKIAVRHYVDVNDISYHQAFIKLVAGTDNRAKNTYFQIIGPIYTNKYESTEHGVVDIVKVSSGDYEGKKGYIYNNQFYEVTIDGLEITEVGQPFDVENIKTKPVYYKQSGDGDFKIRLYQDDLDTIFKTDNNGQLVKPYYLLEPPYNKDLEHLWGDLHSGFFYNYDLTFVDEIKTLLGKLLTFATGNKWPDLEGTKFNEYFFSVQKNLPSIAYNHQSEIYYESTQVFLLNNQVTDFYNAFKDTNSSWPDYNNNKVQNPVSLSHGSCLEAEIEYLRDRVLLLSTYTNRAKKTTDVGIQLNGGSAETLGEEVEIKTKYTSFILYLYPLINGEALVKDTTELNYDPILDYMYWDILNYKKVDLVQNITLPNEPVELSVRFETSDLTLESYWTSTDLYRTIEIEKGTATFKSLFTFPNASTVISQTNDYTVESPEGKEIEVVQHLEGIEHLVLLNANIKTSGLDFTGCNRLKTLILGETKNELTDSPENTLEEDIVWYAVKFDDVLSPAGFKTIQAANASAGFKQLILPKSNSLELIVLPNCVKTLIVHHYPNLTRFECNPDTEFYNLTIDGRNSRQVIEYILNNCVGTSTTDLEITNVPENFYLTETICRKIALIKNVKIAGTINIGAPNNLTDIDWSTKKLLVENFGNILNANNTTVFKYKETNIINPDVNISVNAMGNIQSSGVAPIQLTIVGNSVPIDSKTNKRLKITYQVFLTDQQTAAPKSEIYFADEYVPILTIPNPIDNTYKVRTRVFYTSSSYKDVWTTINVGFYAPLPGDFAYANGTFSSVCDESQGIVGIVFYQNKTVEANQEKYEIRILSAKASSTNYPLGPASYALNFTYSSQKDYQSNYKGLMEYLNLDYTDFCSDAFLEADRANYGGVAGGYSYIAYNTKIGNVSIGDYVLANDQEHAKQRIYISRAASYLAKLNGVSGLPTYIEENTTSITKEGKERFKAALDLLEPQGTKLTQITVGGDVVYKDKCGGFHYGLYPAFLSALYYEPSPSIPLEGDGISYFGLGNWYVPDSRELEKLIFYRINSSISNSIDTQNYWNSTTSSETPYNKYSIFTKENKAFDTIEFLKDGGSQITSVGNVKGEALAYYQESSFLGYDPGWHNYVSDGYSTNCARDIAHKIYPVCKITLIKLL